MDIKNPTAPWIYVVTLPCEALMSAKQAINDKLQGSVAAYLRCGGVVNNQIKKGLLLSLWVKIIFKIGEYLAKLRAGTWLSRALFLRLLAVCWRGAQNRTRKLGVDVCANWCIAVVFSVCDETRRRSVAVERTSTAATRRLTVKTRYDARRDPAHALR